MSNEILESIMVGSFSKRELLLLLYVFRNGYGYNHEQSETEINTSRITQFTRLHRQHIWETLHRLEQRNVLILNNEKILFNRHADSWIETKTVTQTSSLKQLQNVTKTVTARHQNGDRDDCNSQVVSDLQTPKESLKEKRNPHTPKNGGLLLDELFNQLWATYPKKVGKSLAHKAFQKIKPDQQLFDTMIKAIEVQKRSRGWKKENGQFIPHLSTWLNQARWEDELEPTINPGYGLGNTYTGMKGYGL